MKFYCSLAEVAKDFPPPSPAFEAARNQFMNGASGVYVAAPEIRKLLLEGPPIKKIAAALPRGYPNHPKPGDEWKSDWLKPESAKVRYFCTGCGDYFEGEPGLMISPCCDTPKPVRR